MTIKEVLLRAIKTAIQTFGGLMGAVGLNWIEIDGLKMAAIAALTAGLSVVWNAIMTWANAPTAVKEIGD